MKFRSYLGKQFTVISNEARIRRASDLSKSDAFKEGDELPPGSAVGDPKVIPKRTVVTVSDVRADANKNTFAFVEPVDAPAGTPSGWTLASNIEGGLANETAGLVPPSWDLEPLGDNKTVTDRNALVRGGSPDFKSAGRTIPFGTYVSVLETSKGASAGKYVRVCGGSVADGAFAPGEEIGWTSASNLSDGCSTAYGAAEWQDQRGPNACWRLGAFIGQKLLVNIVGTGGEMEQITAESLEPYMKLVAAAAKQNVSIAVESGFRTYAKQKDLYDGYVARKPGFNLAAKPGRSNHQHGQAFDLNTRGFDGPVYEWLKKNGPRLGFIRTVNKEHWHWEYLPEEAAQMAKNGQFKRATVKV